MSTYPYQCPNCLSRICLCLPESPSDGDRLWDEAFANTTPEEWARLEASMMAAEEAARKSPAAPSAPLSVTWGGRGGSGGDGVWSSKTIGEPE